MNLHFKNLNPKIQWLSKLLTLLLLLNLGACSNLASRPPNKTIAYSSWNQTSQLASYAPIIIPEQSKQDFNRIGRAAAEFDKDGRENIYISTDRPVFYTRSMEFETNRDKYTNLIYRFHFPEVPYSLFPFHLTAGKNGGLFVIITINSIGEPQLITTVHTCGCYLAITPTSYLSENAFPPDWDRGSQSVFGESLPGRLNYPARFSSDIRPLIRLRSGTHRVMGIEITDLRTLPQGIEREMVSLKPNSDLYSLPLGGQITPFFHTEGRHRGYVKNTFKPWEFLFMSWWTFDSHVGIDKALGDPDETGTVFYTSLKPWRRDESNMWDFARFLEYWGWQL